MSTDDETRAAYDRRYAGSERYWGGRISKTCLEVLRRLPPERPLELLDVGCGEGANAVFFARNGYHVHALDISEQGIRKTIALASEVGVSVEAVQANINTFRLRERFDIIFSTGTLHSCDPALRGELIRHYREFTNDGGLHVLSVFVEKPFLAPAPDRDPNSHPWRTGELFTHYADWRVESCVEEIFDCASSGVPPQHAVNRIVARKVAR